MIALVLGLNLYSLNAKQIVGNDFPMPFGYGVSIVLSGSMEPALSVNDVVLVKACNNYKVGDVVVYHSGSSLIIHRIAALDGTTVYTQGDANNAVDTPFDYDDICGKMIGKWAGGGRIINTIKSPAGTITVLVIALLLLILSYRKENESADAELDKIRAEIEKLKAEGDADISEEK